MIVLQNTQVVQFPIENDCLKVYIGGHNEKQFIRKMLLLVSARELHNIMVGKT